MVEFNPSSRFIGHRKWKKKEEGVDKYYNLLCTLTVQFYENKCNVECNVMVYIVVDVVSVIVIRVFKRG